MYGCFGAHHLCNKFSVLLLLNAQQNKNEIAISVYPNPSSGKLKIAGLSSEKSEIEIFNVAGEKVLAECVNEILKLIYREWGKGFIF